MRLLIAEDGVQTGDYLRQGLTEAGFVVVLARNGLNGHHLAMTETFDLIILDVMLPDVGTAGAFCKRYANRVGRLPYSF